MSRLDFGQGVWKGVSYRQSALIPTCDAPDLTPGASRARIQVLEHKRVSGSNNI
ncbi:hypothetical protein T12_9236 [Trichinella patagoniensis]|uniref:Uncharacterized protein n=1 Tax=Trichinella patagoniensis TaxID=990121 RepID=A0A0V0YUZ2_9BILA|nr:hypothetical protein T12_9236 [Trichinella patagoniensis]